MITCRSGLRGLERPQRLEAVHARHHHVEQHDVGRVALLTAATHFVAARVRARLVAAQREEGPQIIRERRIVVDDGDKRFLQRFNSVIGREMMADPLPDLRRLSVTATRSGRRDLR